ncbi:hypothetical protein [Chryseobacterium sp. Bi04]|uniref:hypothetical protein n=1 Tax=Chryseobacterium sp. Bi04 TaxID=2822345 RepID=UPI001D44F8FC|nr:hypothetical protein [Chryseobacterium sp. Bi04]CAH0207392.1 hypothetical protein SRABI04_02138 [Chryseobacterium sp. Bi04]
MSKKLGTGDIFYLKIENENLYVFGRVLFDVNSQFNKIIKKTELSEDYFPILAGFYQGYQLVEMYDGIYENINDFTEPKVIIPRVLVTSLNNSKYNSLELGKIKNVNVDYTKVEFPENLTYDMDGAILSRGELNLKTRLSEKEFKELDYQISSCVPRVLLHATLDFQKRRDLIPQEVIRPHYLIKNDLHYNNELRKVVYDNLKLDPDKSYYELSKEMGFDLARFYKH